MIGTVKVPRKFLAGYDTRVSPLWLTNGHWAILKTMLVTAEQATFANAELAEKHLGQIVLEISDDEISRVSPSGDLIEWKFTGLAKVSISARSKDLLKYAHEDQNAYFNRAYIEMANAKGNGVRCEILLGTDAKSAFIDEDRCFVIMPVRGVNK